MIGSLDIQDVILLDLLAVLDVKEDAEYRLDHADEDCKPAGMTAEENCLWVQEMLETFVVGSFAHACQHVALLWAASTVDISELAADDRIDMTEHVYNRSLALCHDAGLTLDVLKEEAAIYASRCSDVAQALYTYFWEDDGTPELFYDEILDDAAGSEEPLRQPRCPDIFKKLFGDDSPVDN